MTKSNAFGRVLLILALFVCSFTAFAQQIQPEITAYLKGVQEKYGLTPEDIGNWTVSDQYTDRESGLTYAYLHQQIAGIRIFNAVSAVVLRNGEVVYFANRFHPAAAQKANGGTPAIKAADAILAAASHLGLSIQSPTIMLSEGKDRHRMLFTDGGIAQRPIRVDLVYLPVESGFRLAWDVNIALRNSPDWWNIRIDALTGTFLDKNNWNRSCEFGHDHSDGAACAGAPAAAKETAKTEGSSAAGYNVFALPLEAPNFGPRSLVSSPELPAASPFGWHDTDGIAGPEYTITRGNNVYAYEDRTDTDLPGYSPDGGAALLFDFSLDLNQNPEINEDAIITNLFYVNNMLHDILFRHGFNEEAGNFQATNYSNIGLGDDYVLAEAQDGGGTNNANFATPDDGSSGRMQMYLWPSGAPAILKVNSPSDIVGDYSAVEASFGPELNVPITSDIVLIDDGTAPNSDGCSTAVNASEISGKIAVIDRGSCPFVNKTQFAESAGAIAVIVINNNGSAPIAMSGNGAFGIPSVMISQADGDLLKAKLANGEKVNVTLSKLGNAGADRDGSLDNGIVIHEYGHGLSNRLTGGPSNSNCLFNGEQGGEGWSDWLALILTIEPGDAGANARGIGTYALDDSTGLGIRRFPYSTDQSVNGQTYGDLALSNEVHDIGEIWSQVLWDLTWKLIDLEGFDPDWYNGNGGNNTALRLVIEGMRIQPCGPGYLDARDAILGADEMLYGNAHRCLIWEAFAGRGMGFNASQGSPNVAGDETEGFSVPTYCLTAIVPPVANFAVNVQTSCYGIFKFTDQSTDIPQNWLWDFGDGTTSTAINPSHAYATPGIYTVKLTVTNTLGMDDYSLVVNYETLSAPAVNADTTVCSGTAITLSAGVDAGNTAQWSTGGTVVHTGTNFTTPSITVPTTYTVQQLEDKPLGHVGPVDNTFGPGGNHNTSFEGRLLFEAFAPFRLLSVQVYAQGAGDRTVTLYNAANDIVQEVTVPVPAGSSRITLNLNIPSAGLYSIGNASQNLYRNNGGATYPYVFGNLVSIYSSNATSSELTYYYYFYDWEVQESSCLSEASTVNVGVKPTPVAGFTTTVNNLTVNFSNTTTGNANSWSWNFGDGTSSSTALNPVHTYAAAGTYTVTFTASNGDCSNTFEQTVTVGTIGTHNPNDAFAIHVFPNPADQRIQVEIFEALTGRVNLQITDAMGRVVYEDRFAPASTQMTVDAADFAAGVYTVRVSGNEGSAVRKVTIMR